MITYKEFKLLSIEEKTFALDSLTDEEYLKLKFDWKFWARENQLQPKELGSNGKFIWMIKAGRGFGKTRTLAEWIIDLLQNKGYRYLSLIGSVSDEVRQIMIEGESGLLECSPPWFYPRYEPSKKKIVWPNGAVARIFYGTEPEKSRGAQSDIAWFDEIAKYQYPEETFDNILFGLRLGNNPLCAVSTTPKPTKFIKDLVNRNDCIVTGGDTYENIENLAQPFIQTILRKYKGTRLGRQEIYAAILDDNPKALWKRSNIDDTRISEKVDCWKLIVAIDPPGTEPEKNKSEEEVTECGIVAVGIGKALDGMKFPKLPHYYVFGDGSIKASPIGWAKEAISILNKFRGDRLIYEKNYGGAMVPSTIRTVDKKVLIEPVWASRGKYIRAEPVSSLYEQERVHHIGTFGYLEDELCEWVPGEKSPNRLDALVWGISWLDGGYVYSEAPSVQKHNKEKYKSVTSNLPS